jgi:hypothetical protein
MPCVIDFHRIDYSIVDNGQLHALIAVRQSFPLEQQTSLQYRRAQSARLLAAEIVRTILPAVSWHQRHLFGRGKVQNLLDSCLYPQGQLREMALLLNSA